MNQGTIIQDFRKIIIGAGFNFFGSIFGKGLFFITQIIIARVLGVKLYGIYGICYALVKICEMVARFGINIGGMRFVSIEKDGNPDALKNTIMISTVLPIMSGIIISIALWVAAPLIATYFKGEADIQRTLRWFALTIPWIAGLNVVANLLRGFHNMKHTVFIRDVIQPVLEIIIIGGFYLSSVIFEGIVVALVCSHFIAFCFGVYYCRKEYRKISLFDQSFLSIKYHHVRKLLRYSFPLMLIGLIQYILAWSDSLFIGYFMEPYDVGVFKAATQISFLMLLILGSLNALYAPLAASIHDQKDIKRLETVLQATVLVGTFLSLPISLFLWSCSSEVLLLFGKDYSQVGSGVLRVLVIGQLINCISAGTTLTLTMTGKQHIVVVTTLVTVVFNIMANMILIPKWGLYGAATAAAGSLVLINMVDTVILYAIYRINVFNVNFFKIILPAMAIAIVLYVMPDLANNPHFLIVMAYNGAVIGVTLLVGSILLLKVSPKLKDQVSLLLTPQKYA